MSTKFTGQNKRHDKPFVKSRRFDPPSATEKFSRESRTTNQSDENRPNTRSSGHFQPAANTRRFDRKPRSEWHDKPGETRPARRSDSSENRGSFDRKPRSEWRDKPGEARPARRLDSSENRGSFDRKSRSEWRDKPGETRPARRFDSSENRGGFDRKPRSEWRDKPGGTRPARRFDSPENRGGFDRKPRSEWRDKPGEARPARRFDSPENRGSFDRKPRSEWRDKPGEARPARRFDSPENRGSFDRKSRSEWRDKSGERPVRRSDSPENRERSDRKSRRSVESNDTVPISVSPEKLERLSTSFEATEKLHKVLARAGLGSRREMETWIQEGRVQVNHEVATLGRRVTEQDNIEIDGQPLNALNLQPQPRRILCYHKPIGEICTRHDPEGHITVFDNLPILKQGRWIGVGRLDINTAGLLLFTTDGELAHFLTHPSSQIEREYAVRVLGEVNEEMLQRLLTGVELEDGFAQFKRVVDAGGEGANHWYHVIVSEGRHHEVRRLWESQGIVVSRLIRIRFGPVTLPKGLRAGQSVELDPEIEQALLQAAGLS